MKKMKKIWIIVAGLFGPGLLFAHDMQGGSTSGLFGLKAAYLHVLLQEQMRKQ
jgi:hypothetical protein